MKGFAFIPKMAVAACTSKKTQTRRVIVPQPPGHEFTRVKVYADARGLNGKFVGQDYWMRCDYEVGERRCLLTTWAVLKAFDDRKPTSLSRLAGVITVWHAGLGTPKPEWAGKSRPGRFLPNALRSHMPVFEVVAVRAERVQDISAADAASEGAEYPVTKVSATKCRPLLQITGPFLPSDYSPKKIAEWKHEDWLLTHFASLWDSINHARDFGWAVNPWVWVVTFRRVA